MVFDERDDQNDNDYRNVVSFTVSTTMSSMTVMEVRGRRRKQEGEEDIDVGDPEVTVMGSSEPNWKKFLTNWHLRGRGNPLTNFSAIEPELDREKRGRG